jgi:oxygen-independent coproporphyrinogen III oxidase
MDKTAVYIHIPFCQQKCAYCDFLSFPADHATMKAYLEGLGREMSLRGDELSCRNVRVETLYIGGGTPVWLPLPLLETLLSLCRERLPLDCQPEWTVEANPCAIDRDKALLLADAGVNRISLGVQDTNDNRLALLGRTHNAARARQAFSLCRNHFPSLSCDLMTGLPGQDAAGCAAALREVASWEPDHLSVYGLKTEENTVLGRLEAQGRLAMPAEEETLAMMETARDLLTSRGYEHYEIANYARPGHACRHNLTYWENRPYLGLGLGAHSCWDGFRLQNTTEAQGYLTALSSGCLPVAECSPITRQQAMEDTMMLGLRLMRGVDFAAFAQRFGCDLRDVFNEALLQLGRDGLIETGHSGVRLSRRGLPLANLVFEAFISI